MLGISYIDDGIKEQSSQKPAERSFRKKSGEQKKEEVLLKPGVKSSQQKLQTIMITLGKSYNNKSNAAPSFFHPSLSRYN